MLSGQTLFSVGRPGANMADDLHDALTDIHGIGDAKAEQIRDVLDAHASGGTDAVREHLESAVDYHDDGQHAYAAKFVRRALAALE